MNSHPSLNNLSFMKSICLAITTCSFVFLASSCSTALTEAQKKSLTTVSISKPHVEVSDFKPVDGTDSPNAATTVPIITGGGLIPALIGSAIDAGVTSYQAKQFKEQYGKTIEQVNAEVPRAIGDALRARAVTVLKKDEFFASRLRSNSPNQFGGELLSYGLERFDRKDDVTYLGSVVSVNIWLKDASGKRLFTETINLKSKSSHPVNDYAGNKKLMKSVFSEAFDEFSSKFASILDAKMGRKR